MLPNSAVIPKCFMTLIPTYHNYNRKVLSIAFIQAQNIVVQTLPNIITSAISNIIEKKMRKQSNI